MRIRSTTLCYFFLATFMLLAVSAAQAKTDGWVPCGNDGGLCTISTTNPVRMRFGNGSNWVYTMAGTKTGSIPCNGGVGNVAVGTANTCEYRELVGEDLQIATHTYKCGVEGETCHTEGTADTPYFMKYGTDDNWVMLPVMASAEGYKRGLCSIQVFGYDPAPGQYKHCETAGKFRDIVEWVTRCSQNQKCRLDAGRAYLVRFGANGKFAYREVSTSEMACDQTTFYGVDPAPYVVKSCEVAKVSMLTIETVAGYWHKVTDHNREISASMTWGVTGSKAKTHTSEWNTAVTVSYENEVKIFGAASQKTSISVEASGGESDALTEALEQSSGQTTEVSCPAQPGTINVVLYQWKFDVIEKCLRAGNCSEKSEIFTNSYRCVYNPPVAPAMYQPVCRPGCCANDKCTVCYPSPAACTELVNPQWEGL